MITRRPEPDAPTLTDVERRRQLVDWNETARDYPEKDLCLHQLIETQAGRRPDRVAVVCEQQKLSYGDLNRRADRLARQLITMGAGPDVPVGLLVDRSVEMVVGIVGILKAGAAYLPIDTAYPQERIAFMFGDAGVTMAVTQTSLLENLPIDASRALCLDTFDWAGPGIAKPDEGRVHGGNLAYVIYTSGSTGRPKGVAIEHRNIVNYVLGVVERLRLEPGMTYATVSTIAADLGNTVVFPCLVTGGCLHVVSRERAENQAMLSDYFGREGIDVLKIVPSHLTALQSGRNPERVMPRRRLILGGEASRMELIKRLRALAPDCEIHNHYGPTEATVGVLTYPVGTQLPHTPSSTLPLGRPLPNSHVYILDGNAQPVPIGEQGELYIGGRGVARGYLDRPELTAEKFLPDPFGPPPSGRMYRTGDIGRYLPDGSIEFCGRSDDQLKVHGYRIELGEIEQTVRELPGVRDAVVLGRMDHSGNNELVAYVVPKRAKQSAPETPRLRVRPEGAPVLAPAGDEILTPKTLRKFLGDRLPQPMIPSAFVLIDKLPLTANGKIDRKALPAPTYEHAATDRDSAAPRTATEKTLAAIWTELLKVDQVGLDDDFFELGGHSLLVIRAVSRIRDLLGVEISLRTVFENTTVGSLSVAVSAAIDVESGQPTRPDFKSRAATARIARQPRRSPGIAEQPTRQQAAIVPLQPRGDRPPIFGVVGHNGDPFVYRVLAQHLGENQPFYALLPLGYDEGTVPVTRVEELAEYFATQIAAFHPAGTCTITGYCAGGTVAFELARRLAGKGLTVNRLVLFGAPFCTWFRPLPRATRLATYAATRAGYHARALARLGVRHWPTYLIGIARRVIARPPEPAPDPLLLRQRAVSDATLEAVRAYTPGRFAGHMDVMIPSTSWRRRSCLRWRKHAATSAVYYGPNERTGHSMLLESHAPVFASLLAKSAR